MAGLIPKHFIHDLVDRADIVEVIDSRVSIEKSWSQLSSLLPIS